MVDKMKEAKLKWFGHMKKGYIDAPMRRCERLVIKGTKRGRDRPKNY